MQIVLFARDDSVAPNYQTDNYHRFDVVDIIDDSIELSPREKANFYIIDCNCAKADVEHLKQQGMSKRDYSLDGLPDPYYTQLIATGRQTIPLGVIIANQRIK